MLTPAAPLRPRSRRDARGTRRTGRRRAHGGTVPLPRTWPIGAAEIVGILVVNGLLIGAMWIRHGGTDQFSTPAGILTAIGQVTALYGTYLALIQLVLMSRSPWLDQVFGMDGLAVAHRWLGFATVWLLLGHLVFTTIGYAAADGTNVVAEFLTFITTYEYVLMATVSAGLFGAIAITSMRAARRRLSYETWYGIHLYAYLAIALGFLHQLFVGSDFMHDPVAVGYWVALYVVTFGLVLAFRVGHPILLSVRHRLSRLEHRHRGARRRLHLRLRPRPGSARRPLRAVLRLAVPHPRRLVARPPVLDLLGPERRLAPDHGQGPRRLVRAAPGAADRDEGVHRRSVRRPDRRPPERPKVLLLAGGIGITPLRALFEALPARHGDMTLLYRVHDEADVVFRAEIEALARARGARVHYLLGPRDTTAGPARPGAPPAARPGRRGSRRLPVRPDRR